MKILNLYAGIGGNRKLWGNKHKITAVEMNPDIAKIYCDFFPEDKMIIDDAHNFLLKNFQSYDFIWSSPPCPSHSRIRNIAGVGRRQNKPIYPDMKLYEEIIFLKQVFCSSGTKFNGKYVVENVRSYYEPLIKPQEIAMHYYWANFEILPLEIKTRKHNGTIEELQTKKGFNLDKYKIDKRTVLRNCVEPETGKHILDCVLGKNKQKQLL